MEETKLVSGKTGNITPGPGSSSIIQANVPIANLEVCDILADTEFQTASETIDIGKTDTATNIESYSTMVGEDARSDFSNTGVVIVNHLAVVIKRDMNTLGEMCLKENSSKLADTFVNPVLGALAVDLMAKERFLFKKLLLKLLFLTRLWTL